MNKTTFNSNILDLVPVLIIRILDSNFQQKKNHNEKKKRNPRNYENFQPVPTNIGH